MYHTSRPSRVVSALGAGTLGLLVLAGPTSAIGADTDPADVGYAKHGNVVVSDGDPTSPPADWRRLLNEIDSPASTTEPDQGTKPDAVTDDESVEYLQITLGALAGLTIAAATAGVLGVHRRRHLAPELLTGK
jgi:hypothetical protein